MTKVVYCIFGKHRQVKKSRTTNNKQTKEKNKTSIKLLYICIKQTENAQVNRQIRTGFERDFLYFRFLSGRSIILRFPIYIYVRIICSQTIYNTVKLLFLFLHVPQINDLLSVRILPRKPLKCFSIYISFKFYFMIHFIIHFANNLANALPFHCYFH